MTSKKSVNISCIDRAKQYPRGTLHADGGKLFCTSCNVTIDHTRKGTIDRHLETPSHCAKRRATDFACESASKKQCTIIGSFSRQTDAQDARNVAYYELVEACTLANIPLNKLDHPKLREYLKVKVKNLGSLPMSQHLLSDYQPKVYELLKNDLFIKVSSPLTIAIVIDEASDAQDRFVLHILFIPQITKPTQSKLEVLSVDLIYLDHVNSTTVSQAIVQCLNKYHIDFNNVCSFTTDNATYMTKAFENSKGLLPNCVHLTCNAHILNTVRPR